MAAEEFDYASRGGDVHVITRTDDKTVYRTVVAPMAAARRLQTSDGAFAPERQGNTVKAFTTGEDYFADVCASIQGASSSVFIAGWQVDWAVKLSGQTRLIDAIKSAADNGARIYVMPWMSPKIGVDTGDLGTMLALFQLNCGRDQPVVFCCPAGSQNDHDAIEETFFSHHQKLVVVDNCIAYVGGLDLAFGRRDDARFSLSHDGRTGPEAYNSCVAPGAAVTPFDQGVYLRTGQLLGVTAGLPLSMVSEQVKYAALSASSDTPVSRALKAAYDRWREPLPEWLRAWAQSAAAPIKERLDRAQQSLVDKLVPLIDSGAIGPQDLQQPIDRVGDLVQVAYVTLLGAGWLTAKPHPMLLKPQVQSAPLADAVLAPHQPRMPWQDVQVRIEGPSVYDLSCNFIRRWNGLQTRYLPLPMRRITRIAGGLRPPEPAAGKGNGGNGKVMVRVLRSASVVLQRDEYEADRTVPAPKGPQHEIHDMMVALIRGAERFVYIENQFFQSECGKPSVAADDHEATSGPLRYITAHPSNRLKAALTRFGATHAYDAPRNQIARALAERIEDAIRKDHQFHAYLVLPVHPEGKLDDPAIVGQVHWTMQSLVFASDSLVNRVRVAIRARQLCKQPLSDREWMDAKEKARAFDPEVRQYNFDANVKRDAVRRYLTLLNLRTAQSVGGRVCTEQIYVHSKLLIVDDRFVVLGSANINDRSLAGGRDSELALCLTDLALQDAPLDGRRPVKVRKLAHELRKDLWKKHFALAGGNGIVQPASELASRLDKPHDPATWAAIQSVAKANTAAYSAAFPWVPRDGASIWPVWPKKDLPKAAPQNAPPEQKLEAYQAAILMGTPYRAQMPFSEEFWKQPLTSGGAAGIRGFICALPMEWTEGQNNHPAMNMILLTQFDAPNAEPGRTLMATSGVAAPGAPA